MRHLLPPLSRLSLPPPLAERLADEIERVVTALRQDRAYFLMYWNSMRERTPMVDGMRTTWHEHDTAALLQLPGDQLRAVTGFYDALSEFQLYVQTTDDMPATLEHRLLAASERFSALAEQTLHTLGRQASWEE